MQRPSRPAGITILAILEILIGIIGLLVSLAIIGLSALASTIPTISTLVGTIGLVIGAISLFFSLIWLATGFGFLHGKGWAWTLGVIFSVLSILGAVGALTIGLITGGIVGLIFWGLMIYYLTRTHVKGFFGKIGLPISTAYQMPYLSGAQFSQPPTGANPIFGQAGTSAQTPTSSTMRPPTPISQIGNGPASNSSTSSDNPRALVSCTYCGSRLTMGSPKCLTCGAAI